MIRIIFSTVRAPHEPALTVESLAIRHTGRPAISAAPVTTPSAGRPSASALAYSPSSTNDPWSTNLAIRSRANSLPRAALAWWYLLAPPPSTALRTSSRCDIGRSGVRAGWFGRLTTTQPTEHPHPGSLQLAEKYSWDPKCVNDSFTRSARFGTVYR